MKIGLYFGSFNPIHNGHLAIADYLNRQGMFDQIWMVVSPKNPLKDVTELISKNHRLNMVKLAIQNCSYLCACDVEFSLPTPSFTMDTLHHLEIHYPNNQFSLILGADNLENFHHWKNYEDILNRYKIFVYPRTIESKKKKWKYPNVIYLDAPLLPISSTKIRTLLQQGKDITEYVPHQVGQYLKNIY
jgi:nicotinate-nucleotide adenylyltransferase